MDKFGQTWVRCSSSTRRRNRNRSPIPLRVPDPDPGDPDGEDEQEKDCNPGGYMGMFPNSRLAKRLAGKYNKSSREDDWCKQEASEDDPKRLISRQRSESPGERGARNIARSKRSRSRSRGRQLEEIQRLQKRKEEVKERLEAARPKVEIKEEPPGDVTRTLEDIIKDDQDDSKEANAFRRKLKKMKAKLSKELNSDDEYQQNEDPEDLEDGELDESSSGRDNENSEDEDVEKKELKNEVTDLKKELRDLKALLKVSESSPEQDQEEDSERDSDDEGNDIESESEEKGEEDKLDLRQLKNMNAFELITKATKSTILSEKMKKQTTASKEEEESERIRRKLKERLQGKASIVQEGKESEQDGLRLKLLQRMRQEEERLELIYL